MAVQEQVYGFFIPSVTLIGIGSHKEVPARMKSLGGKKTLLVTDKGITEAGLTKQITDLLEKEGLETVVFDETVPNPTDDNVHKGMEIYQKNNCDSLITLGGGSAHDCGKGVGLVASNGGKIHDYESIDKSNKSLPPYLAINTGVKEEDIATMTSNAQKDACGLTNPRCPKDEEVMAIYKAAL